MGQYHKIVNLTKKEFINPHVIGSGLKQREQVGWDGSPSCALFMLLCSSNNRGGGDFDLHDVLGRWAGDSIAVIGDYSEEDDILRVNAKDVYEELCKEDSEYKDISLEVKDMLEKEFQISIKSW